MKVWLRKVLGRWLGLEVPQRVVVVQNPLLPREQMDEDQLREAIYSGRTSPAFLALLQIVEEYARNAQWMVKSDKLIADDLAHKYLLAQSYLEDILADVQDCLNGRVRERLLPRKGKLEES